MASDFNREIGATATFRVIAAVTRRHDADERAPYVRVTGAGGDVWLPWGQAELVAQVLDGAGNVHPDGFGIQSFFDVVHEPASLNLRALDPRQGDLFVPTAEATDLARLLRDAAAAVAVIEDIDALP